MTPFIGQIQPLSFSFAPVGWHHCDGALLQISQNTALFSLLGATFGGDGRTTFALPDLRGRSIVHPGTGPGLTHITWGERAGVTSLHPTVSNLPPHTHAVTTTFKMPVNSATGEEATPNGNHPAGLTNGYLEDAGTNENLMAGEGTGTAAPVGGSNSIASRNPFLGINLSIALVGIYPSRN